jgi:hypothetical protein
MATPTKDTIYIDIDDEITTIIDKLNASNAKVVALVLPKRATVLQSIVNMKLLKRASDDSKKNVVLITTEAGLLPLAGASGMFVASTLTSKPVIPTPPDNDETEETVDEDSSDDVNKEVTVATAGAVAVGALAGLPPKDDMETVQLDDDVTDSAEGTAAANAPKADKPKKVKPDKKLSVPNFERFRLWLIIGACLLIALIIGMVYAMKVMPKAVIDIKTDASTLNAAPTLNLSTAATAVDLTTSTLPSKVVTQQKTYTQQATATGQQNNGVKATGSVTVSTICTKKPSAIGAGVGLSASGLTFISTDVLSFSVTGTDSSGNFICSGTVPVKAQLAGAKYNLASGSTFSVAGYPSMTGTNSAAFTGGTDDIITVVSQADIDNAKAKINTSDPAVKAALQTQLSQAGYLPMPATFSAGTPTITTSANVGDAAASVTVTEVVTYSMFGVHETDLKLVVANSIKDQFDAKKQSILDYGLATATYNLQAATDKTAQLAMQTVVTVGPRLNETVIKQQAAGKKSGDAISSINTNPGVTSVSVKLSPFWVSSIPTDTKKITVIIEKPTKAPTTNAPANP